jgi:beta-galactosidase/beta-glucuronidase
VADSVSPDAIPTAYTHKAPVPGLTHSAAPEFLDVDQFQSRSLIANLASQHRIDRSVYENLGDAPGISHQQRNYFWYRRSFTAPAKDAVALLRVNKAQFGIEVFLNGARVGEHYPCFTSATFDVTKAIHWSASNDLVIRVGAHPGVLPKNVVCGTDFEKNRWTPGIYDDVTLATMNNPVISVVQAAPRLSGSSVLVQTELHNYAANAVITKVSQQAIEWKSGADASGKIETEVSLAPSETKIITQTVPIPHAHLWSPEDPFLYKVATTTGGDSLETRFGMREVRFDTATGRAWRRATDILQLSRAAAKHSPCPGAVLRVTKPGAR